MNDKANPLARDRTDRGTFGIRSTRTSQRGAFVTTATKKNVMPTSKAKTAYGLLSDVRKAILERPERYNQRDYISYVGESDFAVYPECGTVACVAGWVCLLKWRKPQWHEVGEMAAKLLGIDDGQQSELYIETAAGPDRAQTPEHAQGGAEHIRQFQQRHAKQLKAKRV